MASSASSTRANAPGRLLVTLAKVAEPVHRSNNARTTPGIHRPSLRPNRL